MRGKVKIYENEGRTKEERENCFPIAKIERIKEAGTR